jgi:hypothetical protein
MPRAIVNSVASGRASAITVNTNRELPLPVMRCALSSSEK